MSIGQIRCVNDPDSIQHCPQLYNTVRSCWMLVQSKCSWEGMCQWSIIDVNSWVLQMCNRHPHTTSLHDQDAKTCNHPYAPLSMRGGTTSYIASISSTPQTQNRIQGSLHVNYILDHVDRPDTVKKRPWQLYNTARSYTTLSAAAGCLYNQNAPGRVRVREVL